MIYLDNAATTPISPKVARILEKSFIEVYGNPSSKHLVGVYAQEMLERSRSRIAEALHIPANGIYFNSGATESANVLLKGYEQFLSRSCSERNEIVISAIEHPAVENTAQSLTQNGFILKKVRHTKSGKVDKKDLLEHVNLKTALVCIIHTNNEIGTIQDISHLGQMCKEKAPEILFITDTVQALGKVSLNFTPKEVDAFFVSGHKLGTPKGMGFFYLNPRFRIFPILHGGGQEMGYRSGTTNVNAAHLLAEAIVDKIENFDKNYFHVEKLNKSFTEQLDTAGIEYRRVIPFESTSPYVLALAFPGNDGQFLQSELAKRKVCVSRGSACSSKDHKHSRILEAIEFDPGLIDTVIRVSFSPENTSEDVLGATNAIKEILT